MNPDTLFGQQLRNSLETRRRQGSLLIPPSPPAPGTVDFGTNDTLSLSSSRVLSHEFLREIEKNSGFAIGSAGGRVGGGPSAYLTETENYIASVHGAESATYFNSGYEANVAFWSSIPKKGDVIIHDEKVHASTNDGMRKGRASALIRFTHNDCDSFSESIKSACRKFPDIAAGKAVILFAVDSFYSISGDIVPIHRFVITASELLPLKNYAFVIDEAHSNGLVGPNGSGFASFWGLEAEMAIRIHTFGKALGVTGAVVLGSQDVKLALLNSARNLLFTTGPIFPVLAAIRASYNLITGHEGEKRRESLQKNVLHFYRSLEGHPQLERVSRLGILRVPLLAGWEERPFQTPIVVVYTQDGKSSSLANELERQKYRVQQGGYPFVPRGLEGIRIMIHADNTEQEIEGLLQAIMAWSYAHAEATTKAELRNKL
ncbi:unnamed protein product [Penicillium olsonii]|nr:unnamed protein product [Penicillium olsonii]CAG7923404.1 unnamed protein product [Penicillium olsonii]